MPFLNIITFKAEAHPVDFLPTRSFERDAHRIFSQEELSGFLNYIAATPDAGEKIRGGSGLRKIRWRANGFGKSGGARVIYFFKDLNMPLLLLAVYAKNERAQMTKAAMKAVQQKMDIIMEELQNQRQSNRTHSGRRA